MLACDLYCFHLIIHAQLQKIKMETFMDLVQNSARTIDPDADEFNFGAMPHEEEAEASAEVSPPLKMGNTNRKRTRNFNDKEDILLASAWLEISMDPIQNVDQTRSTYWQRIHEHFHKNRTFESDRNVSSLSHRWVSFKQVLENFVDGTVRYSVQNKVVSQSKIGYNSSFSTYFEMDMHVVCMVNKPIVICVGSTSMCVVQG
jgi:hypothetical protein